MAFCLGTITNNINFNAILPVSELNKMRREIVTQLEALRSQPKLWQLNHHGKWQDLITRQSSPAYASPSLIVLVRSIKQLKLALQADIKTIYCEFENPRNYREAVKIFREWRHSAINPVPSPQYLCSTTSDLKTWRNLDFETSERCSG